MVDRRLKLYEVKTLFDGHVIGKIGKYVAVPDKFKKFRIIVRFGKEEMLIEKWLNADGFRKFPDKFGRKNQAGDTLQYTLGYFKWVPSVLNIQQPEQISAFGAMSKSTEKQWEKLKERLHTKK